MKINTRCDKADKIQSHGFCREEVDNLPDIQKKPVRQARVAIFVDGKLQGMASKIGNEWQMVGFNLGYSVAQIQQLEHIYQFNPRQRCYTMLIRWCKVIECNNLDAAFYLAAALRDSGNTLLAEEMFPEYSPTEDSSRDIQTTIDAAVQRINFDVIDSPFSDRVNAGQKIKPIFTCCKCNSTFRVPKTLKCGHTFCFNCLKSFIGQDEQKCYTCNATFVFESETEIKNLPTNKLIQDLVDINTKYEFWSVDDAATDRICEICNKEKKAYSFCIECGQTMCLACRLNHDSFSSLKKHRLLDANVENDPVITLRKKTVSCKNHPECVVTSFCVECQCMKCKNCRRECPKSHAYEDLSEHSVQLRNRLSNLVEESCSKLQKLSDHSGRCWKREEAINADRLNSLQTLNELFILLQELLENKKSRIEARIEKIHSEQISEVRAKKKENDVMKAMMISLVDYTRILHQYGSDAHVRLEYEQVKDRLQHLLQGVNILSEFHDYGFQFQEDKDVVKCVESLSLGNLIQVQTNESIKQNTCNEKLSSGNEENEEIGQGEDSIYSAAEYQDAISQWEHERVYTSSISDERDQGIQRNINEGKFSAHSRSDTEVVGKVIPLENSAKQNQNDTLHTACGRELQCPPYGYREESAKEKTEIEDASFFNKSAEQVSTDNVLQNMHMPYLYTEIGKVNKSSLGNAGEDSVEDETHVKIREGELRPEIEHLCVFDAGINVNGMAVVGKNIALISRNDHCIVIYHGDSSTYSVINHKSKLLLEPFDATYTKDKDGDTGLFFTETNSKKRGVYILYKQDKKMISKTFTLLVQDPRGISADDGYIYVCENAYQIILVFHKKEERQVKAISCSHSLSMIQEPLYVFSHSEKLIVTDRANGKITILYKSERKDIYTSSDFLQDRMIPGKCCADSDGTIYVPDSVNCAIYNSSTKAEVGFSALRSKPVAIAVLHETATRFQFAVATVDGKIFYI